MRTFAPIFVVLSLAAVRASALEGAELELSVEPAAGIDAGKLRERLRIELADVARSPVRVIVSAAGARTRVELVFEDGARDTREADLSDAAPGETERVLALSIAEQLRTAPPPVSSSSADAGAPEVSPAILAPRPVPVVPSAPAPERAPPIGERGPESEPEEPSVRSGVHAALGARVFGEAATLLVEPRIGVAVRHRSGARVDVAVLYAHAESTDPLGVVVMNAFGGSLGLSFDRALAGAFSLRAGPRLDVSAGFAEGAPVSGAVVGGTARAPLVVLVGETELRFVPTHGLGLSLAADLGGGLAGLDLRADDRTPSALYGVTFGARFGLLWGSVSTR